jgi:hypothetical protein
MPAPGPMITGAGGKPLGYQQLTPSASTGLTVPAGCTVAVVTADTATVWWRDDGTAPTAAIGMPITVGTYIAFSGDLSVIKFISASGHANVAYY